MARSSVVAVPAMGRERKMMRKQSPETQLRHLKAQNRILVKMFAASDEELRERRQCGQMMSNLCFNLAQNDKYDPAHRQSMRDCREGWDKIKTAR
jgi:hypothetical protein